MNTATLTFRVDGMHCGHCVRAIGEAIRGLDPRAQVDVDLAAKTVRIDGPLALSRDDAIAAIEREGYRVVADPA